MYALLHEFACNGKTKYLKCIMRRHIITNGDDIEKNIWVGVCTQSITSSIYSSPGVQQAKCNINCANYQHLPATTVISKERPSSRYLPVALNEDHESPVYSLLALAGASTIPRQRSTYNMMNKIYRPYNSSQLYRIPPVPCETNCTWNFSPNTGRVIQYKRTKRKRYEYHIAWNCLRQTDTNEIVGKNTT